jgi:protein gp37
MNRTPIGWTDYSWNPLTGCERIGPECKFCYAFELAEQKRGTPAFPRGFELTLRRHKLDEPAKLQRSLKGAGALVFVNSMTDLFWDQVPSSYVDEVMGAIEDAPELRCQILTKRAERMAEFFAKRRGGIPRNVWLGVTCGHPSRVRDVDVLRQIKGAIVRFVSAEPLLADLTTCHRPLSLAGLDWLISGGESGRHIASTAIGKRRALVQRGDKGKGWIPKADREPWIRNLDAQAQRHGVPHFFKQWGGTRPDVAGRKLDGRVLDGMPSHIPGAMPSRSPRTVALPLFDGSAEA